MGDVWVLLVIVGPLGFMATISAVATAAILVVMAIGAWRHLESVRVDRHREGVRRELEPLFSRSLEADDPVRVADEFRVVLRRFNAHELWVAAVLAIELMEKAPSRGKADEVRGMLEHAGIVARAERGTQRLAPWRRALSCEVLGRIRSPGSVPVVLERLEDRRQEVRMAAVRALGEIGSTEAVPALSAAFLERRVAPTNVVSDALSRIGGESAQAFERGVASPDPIIRVSSCFGLAAMPATHDAAVHRLAEVLGSDSDTRVRAAAASALGIAGGGNAPATLVAATTDPEVQVRRAAVKALGFFDDPTTGQTLDECTEDEDRETAIRAAEALFALARRPRAAPAARALLESSSAWSVEYARIVAQVSASA